jgi:hypothetical protein
LHYLDLKFRLICGMAIFLAFAIVDLVQYGKHATRWREYLFLLACVVLAMAYGVANDQVSSRISWEYFYYGKELWPILGPATPPDSAALHWQAARIGAEATWSAGLTAGAAILFTNSLRKKSGGVLPYRTLLRILLGIVPFCVVTGIAFATLGHAGWLNWMSEDFRDLAKSNLWRPRRFNLRITSG